MSRYDRRTTTFNPDGRLLQLEYALEAIGQAGAALGIVYKNGIVMVGEKKLQSKLWISERSEKFRRISSSIVVAIAGISSDANLLTEDAQLQAARYAYKYQQDMPGEMCVHGTCNWAQSMTQYGGLRPFGVSILWSSYNSTDGFQLFSSDPSGNYAEWQATSIGSNAKTAKSILKEDYKENMTKEEAVSLCIKILTKTLDSPTLGSDQLEMCILTVDDKDKAVYRQFTPKEIDDEIKQYQEAHKDDKKDDE